MSSETIDWTITQALAELKKLDQRVNRLITDATFQSCGTANNQCKDDAVNNAVARYQQIRDLKARRNSVKAAIVLSNATTKVKVGSCAYTVAEAIERKASIATDKYLLQQMKTQRQQVRTRVDQENSNAAQRLQRLLENNFGKEGTKTDPESIKKTEEAFWSNNRWTITDPLNLDSLIESLETDIEDFTTNVDFALSESNSRTRVHVA
jgi:hypothetical protein